MLDSALVEPEIFPARVGQVVHGIVTARAFQPFGGELQQIQSVARRSLLAARVIYDELPRA